MGNNPSTSSSQGPSRANLTATKEPKKSTTEKLVEKGNEDSKGDMSMRQVDVKERVEEDMDIRHATFWHNGVQFEGTGNEDMDRKLHRYDDPETIKILQEINEG
ncbi:hypothetical protein CPB84DRAFT_1801440 [Gymnopilus junonius]|uniref:SEP domain-containing protein n=1 Tax=Gymnopilus junonius TaxID=109634 RepID=A0A9P5N7W3_GYMJU|nr:hypothetical protein CPB84DRAFT_1801440 [Gymnopilus junonius]